MMLKSLKRLLNIYNGKIKAYFKSIFIGNPSLRKTENHCQINMAKKNDPMESLYKYKLSSEKFNQLYNFA